MALRELALRRTADRVEGDVQAYRVDKSIGSVWKTATALADLRGSRCRCGARGTGGRASGESIERRLACHLCRNAEIAAAAGGPAREILGTLNLAQELGRDHRRDRGPASRRERGRLRAQPQSFEAGHRPRPGAAACGPGNARAARSSRCSRRTSIWSKSGGRWAQGGSAKAGGRRPALGRVAPIGARPSGCATYGRPSRVRGDAGIDAAWRRASTARTSWRYSSWRGAGGRCGSAAGPRPWRRC
jgi:hypothetical protein